MRKSVSNKDAELKLLGGDGVEKLQHCVIRPWMSYVKDFLSRNHWQLQCSLAELALLSFQLVI